MDLQESLWVDSRWYDHESSLQRDDSVPLRSRCFGLVLRTVVPIVLDGSSAERTLDSMCIVTFM